MSESTILAQVIVNANVAAAAAEAAAASAAFVATKADIDSPTFTGTPRAPTPTANNNSTQLATTAYLDSKLAVANGIATLDSSGLIPANQLPSLALTQVFTVSSQAAMLALAADPGDLAVRTDVNETFILSASPPSTLGNWTELLFSAPVTSVAGLIGTVTATQLTAALNVAVGDSGSGGLQGLVPAAAAGDAAANKYYKASGAFQTILVAEITGAAPLASPTFTGTPGAPTAAVDTNTGQLATTAFVLNQKGSATPLMDGTASPGASTKFAPIDHIHPTDTSLAPLASPTFTGVPVAPTATSGNNTTQLATTAFVHNALSNVVPSISPNVVQRNYVNGASWLSSTSAADNSWVSVCWSPELGLFCAVAITGTGNRVMTSPDGITWTIRTSAADNNWFGICWSPELGLFCAVSSTGSGNRVMTSPDGITWTIRTSAADNNWFGICWSPELGLFCAVSLTGTGNRVMTSPDGITWTIRTSAADNNWQSVCWSPELGLFCAVSSTGIGNRVMTSPDGITWTIRTSAADNNWIRVCWSPELGLFCAVSSSGTGNRVMTSPDGITWTTRTSTNDYAWFGICWSPELGLFCAVASSIGTGDRVMTSPDGITWTSRISAADNTWNVVCWSPELGLFCAVSSSGTGNRVMTSVSAYSYPYRS